MLRNLFKSAQLPTSIQKQIFQNQRSLHTVPKINTVDELKDQGFPGLYSPEGLQKAWYGRAEHYIENLNKEKLDPKYVNDFKGIADLLYKEPSKKSLYENASLLYNTKFALECLEPLNLLAHPELAKIPEKPTYKELLKTPILETENELTNVPEQQKLKDWLYDSFGSVLEFKTLLVNSAMSIKGDGFTWLVVEKLNTRQPIFEHLFILNTYGAGQPNSNYSKYLDDLKTFHSRKELDEKLKDPTEKEAFEKQNNDFNFQSTLIDTPEEAADIYFGSKKDLLPLLAIDASPKAYLHDYGVFGKRQYLERVWNTIDWNKLSSRLPERFQKSSFF